MRSLQFQLKRLVPDMQPITFLMPRAFMASRMFLVPSDIIVVGPEDDNRRISDCFVQIMETTSSESNAVDISDKHADL